MAKKIVIIGAGVGGTAAAALLKQQGHDVILLESHSFVGGRCSGFQKEGFSCDFGVHMFSLGERGPHGDVNRRLNGDLKWVTNNPACRVRGRAEFDLPLDIAPLFQQLRLAFKLGVRLRAYPGTYVMFRRLMNAIDAETANHITLFEYVSRFTKDEAIHLFMNCVCQLYFAVSYREASAGEFIWCFARMFNEAAFGYPAGGGKAIPESFHRKYVEFGGRTQFNEPVERILVANGRASAVETTGGRYPADIVISNAGIARTIELAGENAFPADYTARVRELRYCNAYVTVKYALEKPVIDYPVVFYMPNVPAGRIFSYIDENAAPADPYLFITIPSNQDSALAPEGKQLIIAGTAAPPGASDELCHDILESIDTRMTSLFPGIPKALIWKSTTTRSDASALVRHPMGEAIGLAQTPDQVGARRPDVQTPVERLMLVGSDTRMRGIGTEIASASALTIVDMIANGMD